MAIPPHITVTLSDLTERAVASLSAGDVIREAMTGEPAPVEAVLAGPGVGIVRLTTRSGGILDVTEDHPVMTDRGLVPASAVVPGTQLIVPGGASECTGRDQLLGDYKVYEVNVATPAPAAPAYPPCMVANGIVIQAM